MSASWPPDFKQYENLNPDQIIKAIVTESQNKQAPACYTQFFEQLATFVEDQGELLKKQKALNDSNSHSIRIIESNYNTLTTLYEEEHGRFLDLQENTMEEKLNYRQQLELAQQELAQEKEKCREETARIKQEEAKKLEKQALMRRQLEMDLVQSMREVQDLRQKLKEAEAKASDLEKAASERNPQNQVQQQQQQQQQQHPQQHSQQQHYQQSQYQPQQQQQQQQQPQQLSADGVTGLDEFFAYLGNTTNGYNVVGNPSNYST